ncbi:bifunctional 3'-5' exonuclease/DNA polymerase [Microbacterium lushaniae]|uniref:bifunctional 3'-5' exonuclease/DNA polymerase n=1 Tax=Microbacterium lushaniae TaxID=2614639 RepID=UPI001EE90BA9|nr:bifunctional 3'-5' exonuclease/DNA polymerase [Microbacterium lushaniae]
MTSTRVDSADRVWTVLGRADGRVIAVDLDAEGRERARIELTPAALPRWLAEREAADAPRWVWHDTPGWYDALLADGIRVTKAHDLRLVHAILRDAVAVTEDAGLRAARGWDAPAVVPGGEAALFDLGEHAAGPPDDISSALAELTRQRQALARSRTPGALRLLAAAESAGALLACEMRAAGLPWDESAHDAILRDALGEREGGALPARIQQRAADVRAALGDPAVSLDSHPKLLRALHRAGVLVDSTSRWELERHEHPVIAPLVEYKRLMRLYTANGWAWLSEWVRDGRFRPVYVPGGVVTGRWASSGGGALQIPRQLRAAVRADPGWCLVIADVAQLEPRILAAMARDTALAEAARGRDLYEGIVAQGALPTRAEAKVALLGAMYGATTGDSGRLVPRLRRAFPHAMRLVDEAARTGEDGGTVSTWLGRTSPRPDAAWSASQSQASDAEAAETDRTRARRSARDRGRFTRNFVVQGTAAEWALAWLADLRLRLAALPDVAEDDAAPRSGSAFARRPHLAFYLHDEIIVHAPLSYADAVAACVRESAASAGRLLFGDFPVDFPLDLSIVETAGAK